MKKTALIISALLSLSGCAEFIYDSAQGHNKRQCEKLPPHEYDDCTAQNQQSFQDYQAEREEILSKKPDLD